jgi:UDP-N-acetylmuramoyl-L-alanyl-D-glutamate--2,6-diaminopimelate ligase
MTTPDRPTVYRLLAAMERYGCRAAVLEASSHACAQGRLEGLDFQGAIFTHLTRDHLDYHRDFTAYRDAKGRLFASLGEGRFAVLNRQDPVSDHYAAHTRAEVHWYGPGTAVHVKDARLDLRGSVFQLVLHTETLAVRFPLIGRHNIENALAAAAAARCAGVPPEGIRRGLEEAVAPAGRLERIGSSVPFEVFVDYAHTDGGLATVLSTLRPLVQGRLIVVFGCGGDRDRGKRPLMGKAAERWADRIWLTSDNPRSEDPAEIIRQVEEGIRDRERLQSHPDRARAIEGALAQAREGDCVLIAGKGHETVQVIGDRQIPFDDRQVARERLQALGYDVL